MSEYFLTESIERYINGEMLPEEKAYFEQMRAQNPELNQMIAEHHTFMQTLAAYSANKNFKSRLNDIHDDLSANGTIEKASAEEADDYKVLSLWQRYRKTMAIAACIAGVTALIISGLISLFSPNNNKIELLSNTTEQLQKNQAYLSSKIKEVTKMPADAVIKSGGTAFLIDGDGYLITNAHVLKGSNAVVANNDGQEFNTDIVYVDNARDLAILKITDKDFHSTKSIPYDIKNNEEILSEDVFTLGYPSSDITFNKGYVSTLKGFDGDTATFSISMPANPGNSGSPVFNTHGDVIGVLGAREANAEGVTYVIKSREIFRMLRQWRDTDSSAIGRISISNKSTLGNIDEDQVQKLAKYVYNVKAYN